MKPEYRKLILSAAIASAMASVPMSASATNGIMAYGNGMVSHGIGGAGVANAAEGMSAVDNPALAADVGAGWSLQLSAFNPNRSANVGNGYVESDSDWFPIPGGHWFTDINDRTVTGITVSALGGMNTDYPAELFGAPVGLNLEGVIIAPTIATQVSDAVSIDGAILFGYESLETNGPGMGGLPRDEKESTTGWGFELGIAVKAGASTTIGLDYQSEIDMDDFEEHGKFIFAQASSTQLTLPAITTLGITQKIGENWKISADISDVPWSDIALIKELFGWEDQVVYKIGAEVAINNSTTIRFGFNHGDSQIPDSTVGRSILAPAVTEDHYTIGFSKAMGKGILHGYYARVAENEQFQEGGPGGLPSIKMDQNAFGIGWEVRM